MKTFVFMLMAIVAFCNNDNLFLKKLFSLNEEFQAVNEVELYISSGGTIDKDDGKAAIQYAMERGWFDLSFKLLTAVRNHLKIVKEFDDNEPDKEDVTQLMVASSNAHTEVITSLMNENANVNLIDEIGSTCFMPGKDGECLKIIDNINAPRRDDGATSLYIACENGEMSTAGLLLSKGANIEAKTDIGDTPLMIASFKGQEAIVKLLLDEGANIHAASNIGYTSLTVACQEGHLSIVEMLLEAGANIQIITDIGYTPLMIASFKGHEAIVKLLLDEGANIHAATNDGYTSLTVASQNGHLPVVEMLLEAGANVEAKTSYGHTPLIKASLNGHDAIVKLLLDKGANIHAATNDGFTSLTYARRRGHALIVNLLKSKGCKDSYDFLNYFIIFIGILIIIIVIKN